MNIFELIEPINLSNQVKTDSLAKQKRSLSVGITRRRPAYSFMSSRMSTKSYNDNFIETPVIPQTRKNSNGPVNKSLASRTRFEIMVPDLNKLTTETDRYKFVMSASREVLEKIEPGMYFGIRVGPAFKPEDQQLIYDFDSNEIYRRVNNDYDSFIAYDPRNVYIMLDKNNYKNVFVDTKNYVPILHSQLISADDLYEDEEEEAEYDDLVPYNPGLNPREDAYNEEARRKEEEYRKRVSDNALNEMSDIVRGMTRKTDAQLRMEVKYGNQSRSQHVNIPPPPPPTNIPQSSDPSQFQIPDAKTLQESHWNHDEILKDVKEQYEKEGKERMEREKEDEIVTPKIPIPKLPPISEEERKRIARQFNIPTIGAEEEEEEEEEEEKSDTLEELKTPGWMKQNSPYLNKARVSTTKYILKYHDGKTIYQCNYSDLERFFTPQILGYIESLNGFHGLLILYDICKEIINYCHKFFEQNPDKRNMIKRMNTYIKGISSDDPGTSLMNIRNFFKSCPDTFSKDVVAMIKLAGYIKIDIQDEKSREIERQLNESAK